MVVVAHTPSATGRKRKYLVSPEHVSHAGAQPAPHQQQQQQIINIESCCHIYTRLVLMAVQLQVIGSTNHGCESK